MARKPTGAVVEHEARDGRTYRSLRFTAYGRRRFLSLGPVTADQAERELRHVLADVERGTWTPPIGVTPPPEPEPAPSFHEYAERWWVTYAAQLGENTRDDYRWRLEHHLLPAFGADRLDRITFDTVERYLADKIAEGVLRPSSINKTVKLMAQILDGAVDRDLIARNPARGKARRVRERAPRRTYLDTSGQIEALLNAAGRLDAIARPGETHTPRRAIVATLAFAGLRIGEACNLTWADVDLASGWLHVGDAKTDAGRRRVKIRGGLRDELVSWRARAPLSDPDDYVFATRTGGRPSEDNLRKRVLGKAVKRASEQLVKAQASPLPDGITPHSLRRTFASLLYALGESPAVVMAEMGHTDPGLALRIYAQAMRRDESEGERLRALVEGGESAVIGSRAADGSQAEQLAEAA